ncbi:MAG: restriction endonuclease subunit S [Bacillota bacterium]|nr:restriction endonuclease subunit S [Bacillota bacterium]MDW7678245.1 restriction endonuclease subunit S [Bacillota bacterium]
MREELKPYEAYKETDLEWLEKIPDHWKVVPNKSLWIERKKTNLPDEPLLAVTIKRGVIPQQELLSSTSKKDSSNLDKSKYKLVKPEDIAYNKMRMWQGAVGMSKYRGIVSPAYIILNPRKDINARYYHFLLRSPEYVEESHKYSYGICDDQLSLRYEDFKSMLNIEPPIEEQNQIVLYLNHKLTKINRFIKAKKKQIELLKEQKQAIINQAVTKGLNPDVKMKPSGIKWLGDVPEHWDVKKFARVATVKSNLVNPSDYPDLPQISPENIEKNTGVLLSYNTVHESGVVSSNHLFYADQLIYSKVRPKLNKIIIAPFEGLCSADMYPIETTMHNEYLLFFMLSNFFMCQLSMTENRVKMPKINKDELSSLLILVPPEEEQRKIVESIDKSIKKNDQFIQRINDQTKIITEYRTSLISSVVTGKVDVRHIDIDDDLEVLEENLEDLSMELDELAETELTEDEVMDEETA